MRLEKVTKAGQIKINDLLVLKSSDGICLKKAKEIIRPGVTAASNGEEVVIRKKTNRYFITSMLLSGESWIKEAYIVREQ